MIQLPVLGTEMHNLLSDLVSDKREEQQGAVYSMKGSLMEKACRYVIDELVRQGLVIPKAIFCSTMVLLCRQE
jgi:hypothetical protein